MTNTLDWYADLDPFDKQELLEGFTAQKEEEWQEFQTDLEEADRLDKFTELYYYEWLDFLEYNRKAAEEDKGVL